MTTSTLRRPFDRIGLDLILLIRRIARQASGAPTPRPLTFPELSRIRAPAAPLPDIEEAARDGVRSMWIGGDPEPLHVIGGDPPG